MKVKLASQVICATVASALSTYITQGYLPTEAVGTVTFINDFDTLFDLL